MERERRTRGESSASTERAREAVVARWEDGRGMERVLGGLSMLLYGEKTGRRGTYRVQGKEVDVAIMSNRRAGELWLDFKCINA